MIDAEPGLAVQDEADPGGDALTPRQSNERGAWHVGHCVRTDPGRAGLCLVVWPEQLAVALLGLRRKPLALLGRDVL